MNAPITVLVVLLSVLFGLSALYWLLGLVLIDERQVGIVVKRFAATSLAPGRLIALTRGASLKS